MANKSVMTVGYELPTLETPTITRATLALFAGASGDHNPVHIDIDAARDAGLDDVFAHGMLSMAYLGRVITGWVPQEQLRSYRVRFVAVTPVHARLRCAGTVTAVDEVDGERRATVDLRVTTDKGVITLRGDAVIAVP